jgi:hypothetical protein
MFCEDKLLMYYIAAVGLVYLHWSACYWVQMHGCGKIAWSNSYRAEETLKTEFSCYYTVLSIEVILVNIDICTCVVVVYV